VCPGLTVAENLHLGGAAHASGAELAARVEAELDRFPILRERYRQRAGLLSGGEQQMLAIARSLMSAPRDAFMKRWASRHRRPAIRT
jgi:branched-chain amino acid transport system ATP-binding protein